MPSDAIERTPTIEYIAGFFDGEGCISISLRRGPFVIVTNTNLAMLEAIQAHFGGLGKIYIKKRSPRDVANKTCWFLTFWNRHAEAVLLELRPHLFIKAYEADLALDYLTTMGRGHGASRGKGNGRSLPAHIHVLRERIHRECKAAKCV